MTHVHGGLLICGIAAILGLALGNVVVALSRPWLSRTAFVLEPRALLRVLIGLALAPLLMAVALVGMAFAPSLLGAIGWLPDHCAEAPGALHLCAIHGVLLPLTRAEIVLVVVTGAVLALGLWREGARINRGRRAVNALSRFAVLEDGVWRIDSDEPMAFSAGLFSPRIYLSRGLERRVGCDDIDVILAHERQHAASHDALVRWLLRICSAPLVGRRDLMSAVAFAQERLADEQAALVVGDRLRVAETLLRVCRLTRSIPLTESCAIASSHVETRVDALCREVHPARLPRELLALLFMMLLLVAGLVAPLHDIVERAAGAMVTWGGTSPSSELVHHTHE